MTFRIAWWTLFGALLLASAGPGAARPDDAKPDGRTLFVDVHKCSMCHAVPAAKIVAKTKSEAMRGSDLGGAIDIEPEKLFAYLRRETELDGTSHKKPFKGTDEELQVIVDWLGSLEAQE